MRAVGWHSGGDLDKPSGYGLRITPSDRDRTFDPSWDQAVVELDGAEPATVDLPGSFWRSCSELRSAEIGRWLLDSGAAPWNKGNPPAVALRHIDGNRFSARLLKSRSLI